MNIVVYCGSSSGIGDKYLESARVLGKWIGGSGNTLVYGGASKGLMGAVSDATLEAGGKVIGVIPNVPRIQARRHQGLTVLIRFQRDNIGFTKVAFGLTFFFCQKGIITSEQRKQPTAGGNTNTQEAKDYE